MHYIVFTEDEALKDSLCSLIRPDDTLEAKGLGDIWSHRFSDEVMVSDALDRDDAAKIRRYVGSSIPILFLLGKDECINPHRNRPEDVFLVRPFSLPQLRRTLSHLVQCKYMLDLLSETIVGHSEAMAKLRSEIISAAFTSSRVHITGETGTGKTLAAEMIHMLSGKKKEMVSRNCVNFRTTLSESLLFGNAKGAYTGSTTPRHGLLAEADGTTLFLDEIDDIPMLIQGNLLDVLDKGTYRAVGTDQEKKTRFRLITAGKTSLPELVAKGKMREDFYYRISQMEINIEPLRKHPEDIPDIVEHFFRERHKRNTFTNYDSLMSGEWNGNVRELLNHLERYAAGQEDATDDE